MTPGPIDPSRVRIPRGAAADSAVRGARRNDLAAYHSAFSRWITRAQAFDFLELLRCFGGTVGAVAPPGRWVQREGCIVRFCRGNAPGRSRIHEHRLLNTRIAEAFAVALLRTGDRGGAAPIDPEEWAGWQHEHGGLVSAPSVALPAAIHLADRRTG